MTTPWLRLAPLALACLSAGCATGFMGTAPSTRPGSVFVVGHKGGYDAIWSCPTSGPPQECKQVEVDEK